MTYLAILKIIRKIVNNVADKGSYAHTEVRYYGVLMQIRRLLIEADINEN